MYAIIETGGKQVRVAPGNRIKVERLKGEVGDNVQFDNVLLFSDGTQTVIGTPHVEDTPVIAKILDHGRGKKIRVIKMKRRKNYRRTYGHRQNYTELEVLSIGAASDSNEKAVASNVSETDSSSDESADD